MQRGRTWGDLDEVDTGVVDSDRHFLTGTTSQLKEIKTRPATFAFSRSLQIGGDTRFIGWVSLSAQVTLTDA
jgi:hypothetical protein